MVELAVVDVSIPILLRLGVNEDTLAVLEVFVPLAFIT